MESHLDGFQSDDPTYRLVEVDADTKTYDKSHVPGAIEFSWESQLQDQTTRDVLTKEGFEDLLGSHGISEDSTVVLYGGDSNWFAACTYWRFKYYGRENVHLTNDGRDYWVDNDYPTTDEISPLLEQDYSARGPFENIRAYRDDVGRTVDKGLPLVDARSSEEFSGEILVPPGLQETAQCGSHIPGAGSISWVVAVNGDDTFKSADEPHDLYADQGIGGDGSTIAYYRIGERLSIVWFALYELLGYENVTNYDGSWTGWGNLIGVPVKKGN